MVGFSLSKGCNEVLAMDVGEYENQKFLVMTDQFSWYVQGVWLKNKKPEEIVKGIMTKWIPVYGVPKKILIDNGREFQNEKVRRLTDALDIEVLTIAGESPFSNGRCERTVGLIKDGLKKMEEDGECVRREMTLNWILLARNTLQMVGGYSPHQLVFGRNPDFSRLTREVSHNTTEETLKDVIIIWGVSRSRQHSRSYIAEEEGRKGKTGKHGILEVKRKWWVSAQPPYSRQGNRRQSPA